MPKGRQAELKKKKRRLAVSINGLTQSAGDLDMERTPVLGFERYFHDKNGSMKVTCCMIGDKQTFEGSRFYLEISG